MPHFAVAGIQTHVWIENNLGHLHKRLDLLMHLYPWVQMVVLSELAAHGPVTHSAEPLPGPTEAAFQAMARQHRIWLVPGSFYERRDGAVYNTTPVIDPHGDVVARYSKIFPFTPYEEGVTPGREFCVFDVPEVGRFGVAICYDIWFPEIARTLTSMGVEVILNPVLAHFIDRDADLLIAQATAAMFQSYVFHINGLGAGGTGRSLVVGADGRVLHQAGSAEELIPIEIDLGLVRRERARGLRSMGQPLKSFRDRSVEFPVYDRASFDDAYLRSLGSLAKPRCGDETNSPRGVGPHEGTEATS
ncbi:MAG: carbon-nitrogen hydrolase family protein [Rhodospirillales bacterium]